MEGRFFNVCVDYVKLGYEVNLTYLIDRPSITIRSILYPDLEETQSVADFDKLKNHQYLDEILDFMYRKLLSKITEYKQLK